MSDTPSPHPDIPVPASEPLHPPTPSGLPGLPDYGEPIGVPPDGPPEEGPGSDEPLGVPSETPVVPYPP